MIVPKVKLYNVNLGLFNNSLYSCESSAGGVAIDEDDDDTAFKASLRSKTFNEQLTRFGYD